VKTAVPFVSGIDDPSRDAVPERRTPVTASTALTVIVAVVVVGGGGVLGGGTRKT
jgi:hypothetical protein